MKRLLASFLVMLTMAAAVARADTTPDQRRAVSDQMMAEIQRQYGPASNLAPEQKAQQIFNTLVANTHRRDVQ